MCFQPMSANFDLPGTIHGTGKSPSFEGKEGVTLGESNRASVCAVRVSQPNVSESLSAPGFSETGRHN